MAFILHYEVEGFLQNLTVAQLIKAYHAFTETVHYRAQQCELF
jgi:hypothetical protein